MAMGTTMAMAMATAMAKVTEVVTKIVQSCYKVRKNTISSFVAEYLG
jgi:hypothetical protein